MEVTKMEPEDLFKTVSDIVPEESRNALFKTPMQTLGLIVTGYLRWRFDALIRFGMMQEYEVQMLSRSIEEKAAQSAPENYDEQKLGISMKAIDEAKYSISDETLREMFANLIVKSVDKTKNGNVSPLMVSILSDMSPKGAKFFKDWYTSLGKKQESIAGILILKTITPENGYSSREIERNIIMFNDGTIYREAVVVDELLKLGIIEIPEGKSLVGMDEQYAELEKNVAVWPSDVTMPENSALHLDKTLIRLTPIGEVFARLVLD